jgi:hypothetical protein
MSRSAGNAKKYGPNEKSRGFTNMVNLQDLVNGAAAYLPQTAGTIAEQLQACVVYQVNGPYRARSCGLSCYFPLDMDEDAYRRFAEVSGSQAQKYLCEYLVYGQLRPEAAQYASGMAYEALPGLPAPQAPALALDETDLPQTIGIAELGLEDYPVDIDEDGYAVLNICTQTAEQLSSVTFELAYYKRGGRRDSVPGQRQQPGRGLGRGGVQGQLQWCVERDRRQPGLYGTDGRNRGL